MIQIDTIRAAATHESIRSQKFETKSRELSFARDSSVVLSKVCDMNPIFQKCIWLVCLTWSQQSLGQNFFYVEPGNPACPVVFPPAPASPQVVKSGVAIAGSISVRCSFDKGSYTVNLNASDPMAAFSPKSFLVNFASVSGPPTFTVTFKTVGIHHISATITSNMGSPAVPGRFSSVTNEFTVVRP